MASRIIQWIGRRWKSGTGTDVIDTNVLVDAINPQFGVLQVAVSRPDQIIKCFEMDNVGWDLVYQDSDVSAVLRKVYIHNNGGGARLVSLGLRGTSGTPSASQAVIAWNTSVALGAELVWEGELYLHDNYLYCQADNTGVSCIALLEPVED